jgi:hypothetical protein
MRHRPAELQERTTHEVRFYEVRRQRWFVHLRLAVRRIVSRHNVIRRVQAVVGRRESLRDIDLVEINEAFAVQVLASARALGVEEATLNVSGGAIALGHPFGMTGARIAISLLNNLSAYDGELDLETMCVGGGEGMAMILERLA